MLTPIHREEIARLRALLEASSYTRLHADYISEEDAKEFEPGWRIHDMPEDRTDIALFVVDGLEEADAALIVEAVNALPGLLNALESLSPRAEVVEQIERAEIYKAAFRWFRAYPEFIPATERADEWLAAIAKARVLFDEEDTAPARTEDGEG